MAGGWVKSLQCKTRAFDDVRRPELNPSPKTLISSSSCRRSVQSIKDVIDSAEIRRRPSASATSKTKVKISSEGKSRSIKSSSSSLASLSDLGDPTRILRVMPSDSLFLPTLTELGEGHPSRKVVEIIFKSSWSPSPSPSEKPAFTGRVEMVFKVQNPTRTLTRFEEYRESIKSKSGSGSGYNDNVHGRCSADGNEVLRFHCLGPTVAGNVQLALTNVKCNSICTYSGSGKAHESGGGGNGRKGMMVCRVIAGRVGKKYEDVGNGYGFEIGYDSVSGDSGELVVLDPRAVLPCFLIIYKV